LHFLRNHYNPSQKFLPLGGGSNVLFLNDFNGTVLLIASKGIEYINDDYEHVIVKAEAGEKWEEFVDFCVEKGFSGLENLSLIPGSVGASPIQNIGAYGVEVKDVLHTVEAVEIKSGIIRTFRAEECGFAYRSSIFKTTACGRFLITAVSFRLSKVFIPKLAYGALDDEFKETANPALKDVAEAIKRIRRSKLPDPAVLGNAGSFFKNPAVSTVHYNHLHEVYPEIVGYPADDGFKLAAGWLIEKAGWKGKCLGNAAVHDKQALVISNKGNATGQEILNLAREIQKSVFQQFGVALEAEVNFVE
jgi:UDP-N-acetylmuramate dehydrogenase